jgi:hypothetical protein
VSVYRRIMESQQMMELLLAMLEDMKAGQEQITQMK